MLGALGLLPHTTALYEMVPLLLIPRRPLELVIVIILGYVAQWMTYVPPADVPGLPMADLAANWLSANWMPFLVLCYLPALLLVLARPNAAETVVQEPTANRAVIPRS
jgi:hypothetical protein